MLKGSEDDESFSGLPDCRGVQKSTGQKTSKSWAKPAKRKERDMKKMKKFLAMLLALVMVMGMSVTTLAEEKNNEPKVTAAPATISGVAIENPMPTITAYRIIKYNENGYYEEVIANTITKKPSTQTGDKEVLAPSSEDVQELYYNHLNDLKKNTDFIKSFTAEEGVPDQDGNKTYTGSYTCNDLGLGTWMIVVSGSGKYLYNPAIISVSQTPDGVDYGRLNLETDTWKGETGVYLKRDEPTITKTAEKVDDRTDATANTGVAGTQYNDILKFTITSDIPAYTSDRTNISYVITDTIKGLDYLVDETHEVSVKVGKDATEAKDVDNTILQKFVNAITNCTTEAVATETTPAIKKFVVNDLGDEFLTGHSNQKLIIEYYAQVTSKILVNVDRLNNKAELEYSHNGDTTSQTTKKDIETKHYTFGIDTTVTGWKDSASSHPTGEFIKVGDNGEIQYTETPGEVKAKEGEEVKFLDGAVFQLRIGNATNGPLFTDKTGKNSFTTDEGRLQIVGLDDGVDYYLIETKAPTGYTLNTTAIKVRINATYSVDQKTGLRDVLTGYEVVIGEGDGQEKITHYGYDVTTGKTEFINTKDTPSNPFGFKNTTLLPLPSTGGIGTTIFTFGGCAIMIIAAGLYFAMRRKSAK